MSNAAIPAAGGPDAAALASMRGEVARAIAEVYPAFAARTWGIGGERAPAAALPAP